MKISTSFYILTVLLVFGCNQKTDETIAIRKVLEKESATWRAGDVKGHASCWSVEPYSKILVSTGDGTVIDVPPAAMLNPSPGMMGKGGSSVNSNYKMRINGMTAWVSHDETSTAANGEKTYSAEIRMLEKINGEWKIVGQSIHIKKK